MALFRDRKPRMLFRRFLLFTVGTCVVISGPAAAQADANAVTGADDAFGFREGDEAVGIYDETSVRGFSLEAAGNYRINGSYFVRNSGVSALFLESTTVQIGYNTLNVVLPGPSGVVNYRLRDPARGEPSTITLGLDPYAQPYAELLLKRRARDDSASFSFGVGRVFELRDQQGGRGGNSLLVAGTARLTQGPVVARIFGGEYQYERAGQFRVVPTSGILPPPIADNRYLGQDWARETGQRRIAGALIDSQIAPHAGFGATAVFSQEDPTQSFVQLFTSPDANGSTTASVIAVPRQRSTAWSGELRANWQPTSGAFAQRLDLSLRGRRQRAQVGGGQIVPLGQTQFGERPEPAAPPVLDKAGAVQRNEVDQYGLGLTYRASWQNSIRVNIGVLRTDYAKRFVASDGSGRGNRDRPWLYNGGVAWNLTPEVALYGSYSRGLEEAGIAPAVASNRNEVLEAIIVTQRELGVRYVRGESFSLVIAGFDTRKPYAGIDGQSGAYRFLGQVRHRGIEASFSGRPAPGLSVVLGGVLLAPVLSTADADMLGPRPVAVPRVRVIANVDYALPFVPGMSLDAGFSHVGGRPVTSRLPAGGAKQLTAEKLTVANLGARYGFEIGGRPLVLRAQVLNVFNQREWEPNTSETLAYSPPRRVRLVLTAPF